MSPKYPKYTKEQDGRCKLYEQQIEEIRELKLLGYGFEELARKFKVTSPLIRYWVDDEYREKTRKRAAERQKMIPQEIKNKANIPVRNKKRALLNEEYNKYIRELRIIGKENGKYQDNRFSEKKLVEEYLNKNIEDFMNFVNSKKKTLKVYLK